MKEGGTTQAVPNSVFQDGRMTFATPHLSTCTILSLDGAFDPQGAPTRAELAAILRRPVALTVG